MSARVRCRLIAGLTLSVLSTLLVLLALELILRADPTLLGDSFASGAAPG